MAMPSTPKRLVRELISRHAMSQTAIAQELRRDGFEVSQPTISRIARGYEKISFDVFRGLVRLHERVSQQPNS